MIRGSELIGVPILKEDKKIKLTYTKDIIYGKNPLKVIAFSIKMKNSQKKNNRIIPFQKIKDINHEEIIIVAEKDIIFPHEAPEINSAVEKPIKVIGFHIYDEQKNLVGTIRDTIIEKNSGKILAFIISEGVIDDLIEGHSILPLVNHIDFQRDYIVIGNTHLETISSQGGGLKKLLGIK
ncbi:PRC-barrel domain-containing protein [Natronincola ferrireducens]|uniref:Uncharacterized protein YrrD, contains PRC-barrel domain n=1 Tax=Natronincola ferrireducens TaxID=393762 RepID=A0A1G9CPS8_9FIRM|nr:PRC-barrel domain-containing protein [Natronincola ferrireducens]SDK53691.1 Uncharacterized protein YrrD, contains PRC-barrel domain [Natronincola ferrireducens]